jgi:hypothetical protein
MGNLEHDAMTQEIRVSEVQGENQAQVILDGLNRPAWFKDKMKPLLAKILEDHPAVVFEALNSQRVGTGVFWLDPPHYSHGKVVPTFGWVDAENKNAFRHVIGAIEVYAKANGVEKLRGPINLPNIFGGWGVLRNGFDRPLMVDSAWNRPELGSWYESMGYSRITDYISVEVTEPLYMDPPFPNIRCESYPIADLLANAGLMGQIGAFVKENFSSFLPDTSPSTHMMEIFDLLAQVDHSEDFYVLAFDDANGGKLVAAMLQIPNIFDVWSGKPLESANINTVIVDKDYRGHDFFHWVFTQLVVKLRKRGVIKQVGGAIWSRNKQGMYTFLRVSKQVADFSVYEKIL